MFQFSRLGVMSRPQMGVLLMGMRSGTTFKKRQKEIARMEKQRDKIAKRLERKVQRATGGPIDDMGEPVGDLSEPQDDVDLDQDHQPDA
jgi:hypothetical protein